MMGTDDDEETSEASESDKKQARETPRAIAAFALYCEMGPGTRSLAKLQVELAKQNQPAQLKTLKTWSRSFGWQKRVSEYDMSVAAERRAKLEKAIEDMNLRHVMMAVNQQLKMTTLIDELIKRKKFGSMAATTLLKLSLDLERLARGAPTEQSKVEVGFDQEMPLKIVTTWDRALTNIPADNLGASEGAPDLEAESEDEGEQGSDEQDE